MFIYSHPSRFIQGMRGRVVVIGAQIGFGHTFFLESAEAFIEQAFAETFALEIGMCSHRFEVTNLGHAIGPDDAVRGDCSAGCYNKNLMLGDIDW